MLVSTDIKSAHRDGITVEIARARRAAGHTGTWIDPGIDGRRAGLKCPLGCRLADAMVAQAVHQRILVVNTMWFW